MEVYFLDTSFQEIYLLDSFKSLIWTDRYWLAGEIDLSCTITEDIIAALASVKYFKIAESPHRMILETINIKTDVKDGNLLVLKGRSLESLLDRRIVWNITNLEGNLQTGIQTLLNENAINPTDTDRDLPLSFITSTDPSITGLTFESQFGGESLYQVLSDICRFKGIGFRVFYSLATSLFTFELYSGINRSYDQDTVAHVAFTEQLDNLLNAEYIESGKLEKTVCLVAGEQGIGNLRTTVEVDAPAGGLTGLNRKEHYLEANINRRTDVGEMTDEEYLLALTGKGEEELAKKVYLKVFDGEVDTNMYNYGEDFNMGDIVQIADNYGHVAKSRVIEMVFSSDAEGYKNYPIFETIE